MPGAEGDRRRLVDDPGFLMLARAWKPMPGERVAAAIAGTIPGRTVGPAAEVSSDPGALRRGRSGRSGPGAPPAVRSTRRRTDRGWIRRGPLRPGRPGGGAGGLG